MKLGIVRPLYLIILLLGAVSGAAGTYAIMSRAAPGNANSSSVSPDSSSNSCSTQCQITNLRNQIVILNSTIISLNSNLKTLNGTAQHLDSEVADLNRQVNQLNVTLTALTVHPPTAPYAFVYGYVTTPCSIGCGPHTPITGNITFVPYNATYPRLFVSVTGGSGFYQANLTLTVQYLAHVSVIWDTGNPGGCYIPVTISTPGITRFDFTC